MFYYAEMGDGDRVIQQHNEDEAVDPLPENWRVLAASICWTPPFPGAELVWTINAPAPEWADPRTLQEAKDQAWERIKAARDLAEHAPFTVDGHAYDADEKATARISGATTKALMAVMQSQVCSFDFILADNNVVTLDGAQMMAVGAALGNQVEAVFATGRALRDAIDAVEPGPVANATLDSIQWPVEEANAE